MKKNIFPGIGVEASALGFGCMRFPTNEDGTINRPEAIRMLRHAIDNGVTYVDTAYIYGDSERITGLCLQDGYREKVTLATKLPVYKMTCEEDFNRLLDEQLARLQTDHIDAYLLHALNRNLWENYVKKYNVLALAEQARAAGKIRYLGFSFHDSLDVFKEILHGHDKWDFCQIQLNYMDTRYQAGLEGLQLAHEKGLAVVIMEPLRGGVLANVPQEVSDLLPKNPVESALDYLWNMEQVNVVLSGMSELEQVDHNLAYADRARVGMLTQCEQKAIEDAGNRMRESLSIPCTGCDYCSVCPQQIAISKIFRIFNQRQSDGNYITAKESYRALGEHSAKNCVNCNLCAKQCPQQIPIPEHLASLHKQFG